MKTVPVLALLLSTAAACAIEPDESEATSDLTIGALTGDVIYQDPPPPPPPQTTLTFYANTNYTGASWTVSLLPSTSIQGTMTISTDDMKAHGLYGAVSSVRLICGVRPSHVSLFSTDWGEFSKGTTLSCQPNHGAAIANLANVGYDNRINAAALVAHPVNYGGFPFSALFDQIWHDHMLDLPDGASAAGTQIWLQSFRSFRIYQHFTLSHIGCSDRDAAFDLRITVSKDANGQPVFTPLVMSTYVAYGFGDAWGCHDGMLAKINAAAGDAGGKLRESLPGLVNGFSDIDAASTFYFMPDETSKSFGIYYAD